MAETLFEKYPELADYADRPVFDLRKLIKKIEGQRRRKRDDEYMQGFLAQQRERRKRSRSRR